jgi:hypothetical protein
MAIMGSRANNLIKNKTNDREIVLEKIAGKNPLSSSGIVDTSLFNGQNGLHAVVDTQTMLWSLKQVKGSLPPPLRQQFTSFTKLMQFVTEYYKRRNINVVRVID